MSGTATGAAKALKRRLQKRAAGLDTGPRLGRRRVTVKAERAAIEAAQERLALEAAAERARLAPQRKRQAAMDRDRATRIYAEPPRPEPLPLQVRL